MTNSKARLATLIFASAVTFAALPAFAAPSGGSNSNTPAATPPASLHCGTGEVPRLVTVTVNGVKKKKWKCVLQSSERVPDKELYELGKAMAFKGQYDQALDVLAAVKDQSDADVLNMQGYSHRKAGRLDVAITYYRKALSINPDFVRAREYLGEGYVAAGRVDLATNELVEIKSRCGVTCEEYKDLAKVIAAASN